MIDDFVTQVDLEFYCTLVKCAHKNKAYCQQWCRAYRMYDMLHKSHVKFYKINPAIQKEILEKFKTLSK